MLVPTVRSRAASDSRPPSSPASANIASPQYCSVSTSVPSMSNSTARRVCPVTAAVPHSSCRGAQRCAAGGARPRTGSPVHHPTGAGRTRSARDVGASALDEDEVEQVGGQGDDVPGLLQQRVQRPRGGAGDDDVVVLVGGVRGQPPRQGLL